MVFCSLLQPRYNSYTYTGVATAVIVLQITYLETMSSFFSLNPQVNQQPTPLPSSLIKIITPPGMDWTSTAFIEQFNTIISTV